MPSAIQDIPERAHSSAGPLSHSNLKKVQASSQTQFEPCLLLYPQGRMERGANWDREGYEGTWSGWDPSCPFPQRPALYEIRDRPQEGAESSPHQPAAPSLRILPCSGQGLALLWTRAWVPRWFSEGKPLLPLQSPGPRQQPLSLLGVSWILESPVRPWTGTLGSNSCMRHSSRGAPWLIEPVQE